jgi:hypothetical protein
MSYNHIAIFSTTTIFAATLALFLGPTAGGQSAVVQAQDGQSGLHVLRAQNIVVNDTDGGESHTVEIRVIGDKVVVIRDGKEVPHAQISEGDDKIIITDKDGKQLHELKLRVGDGKSMYYFGGANVRGWNVSDAEGLMAWRDQVAGAKPTVMLGASMTVPGPALEKHLRLESGACTMLNEVYEGLPAHEAGLGEYDIIVKVNGQSPADNDSIRKSLAEKKPGDTITFTVIQEGKTRNVAVELKAYDPESMSKAKMLGSAADQGMQFWMGNELVPHVFRWQRDQPLVYFAPEKFQVDVDQFNPQFEKAREFRDSTVPKVRQDVEQQLQRLDERLAELEKLLQKLIERRETSR